MAKGSDYLLIRCFDPRLNDVWVKFMRSLGLRPESSAYDLLSTAGGAGDLAQLLNHLKLAFTKHGARTVVLTVHEDCAADAGEADLFRALAAIREEAYVGLTLRAFYFYQSGNTWAWREMTN